MNSNDVLWNYVQSLNRETISKLSKPTSPEILELIKRGVFAILQNLSHGQPNNYISINRDQLGMILSSAMIDGYFLRNVEQRAEMDKALQLVGD